MTAPSDMTASAAIVTQWGNIATLAAYGDGGAVKNVDPKLFVTDGNLTKPINATFAPSLLVCATALATGSPSNQTAAQWAAFVPSLQQAITMASAAKDAPSVQALNRALEVVTNLSNGI